MLALTSFLDRRALTMATASALLFSGFSINFGCGEDPVELEFKDASEGCNTTPDRLEHPVARGARLDVSVSANGEAQRVSGVSVDDPAVLGAGAVDDIVSVQALAVGETRVSVETESGGRGHLDLRVAEPASADIAPDSLTVWNLDATLTVRFPEGTADFVDSGYALLPDGELHLGVVLRDAAGEQLIGFGVASWTASPDAVDLRAADPRRDDITVTPRADETGSVELATIAGGLQAIELLPDQEAASLEIYLPETGVTGGPIQLPVGEVRTVVLVAFDGDGRLLLGNGEAGFSAVVTTVGGEPAVALIDPPWATGDLALDDAARASLEAARVVTLEARQPGEATLLLETTGQQLEVQVTVTE